MPSAGFKPPIPAVLQTYALDRTGIGTVHPYDTGDMSRRLKWTERLAFKDEKCIPKIGLKAEVDDGEGNYSYRLGQRPLAGNADVVINVGLHQLIDCWRREKDWLLELAWWENYARWIAKGRKGGRCGLF